MKKLTNTAEQMPESIYYGGILASCLLSVALYASGRKSAAIFVGIWAPAILNLGIYAKLLRRISHQTIERRR
jgi:hypothetical protein